MEGLKLLKLISFKKNIFAKAPNGVHKFNIDCPGFEVRQIKIDDIVNDIWLKRWSKQFLRMLKQGHMGFIVIDATTCNCVGYAWLALDMPKPGHLNILPNNSAWFHNDRVKEEYRGRGLAKLLYKARIDFIKDISKDIEIYSDTNYKNIAVRRIFKSLNFIETGTYYYISIGSPRIPFGYFNFGVWHKDKNHEKLFSKR